jgi:hypothetical protein
MKKLTWKKVTTLLFLSVFLAACGSDSEQAVEVSKAAPQKVEDQSEETKEETKEEETSSVMEVSDFNVFKSKVSKGEFASVKSFKKNMMMENANTIQVHYAKCNLNNYDAYEAEEDAGFWSKVGDFLTPSVQTNNCMDSFYHTVLGESVMRSDLKAKDELTTELNDVISNASSATKVGSASFQILKGSEIYMIDLNFPLELNPVYKYKPSGRDAEYYKYYGTQYGY